MKVLHDIIAVEPIIEDKTPGGLWIPNFIRENIEKGVYFGTVKFVGPEVKNLHVGDTIIYCRWQHEPYDVERDCSYHGMHESDVLSTVDMSQAMPDKDHN